MRNNSNKIKLDWWLVLIVLSLITMGIINLYSAAYNSEYTSIFDFRTLYGKQLMWVGLGTFIGIVISLMDVQYIRKFTPLIFGFVFILLILVLFTKPINGARSWLGFGPFGIQPSEFAKLATSLMIAYFLSEGRSLKTSGANVSKTIITIFVTMLMVLIQNDTGTFLVFTAFFFVLYREGITLDPIFLIVLNKLLGLRLKQTWVGVHFIPFLFIIIIFGIITLYLADSTHSFSFLPGTDLPGWSILILILTGLTLLTIVIFKQFGSNRSRKKLISISIISYFAALLMVGTITFTYLSVLQSHQKVRIDLWLGKIEDKDGEDYNRNRALAAVGSGGFKGIGYHQAILASPQSNHVPESETDFIFCVYAEEWGFIGSFFLICLYILLLMRIAIIAERQRSQFSRIFSYSVGMILFYHFAINIGMNVGVLPVIGIPLPFLSYGGSSMMAFIIMIAIVLKLDSQRKDILS